MAGSKDNMRQAMRELLGKMASGAEPKPDVSAPEVPVETPWSPPPENLSRQVDDMFPEYDVYGTGANKDFKEFKEFQTDTKADYRYTDYGQPASTVISEGTFISGDIRSDGNVEIRGKLKGNLETTGSVRISGKMIGDVRGESITLVSCAIQGNISAASDVSIDSGTLLVGDIMTGALTTDGKVKGNIQASKSVVFQANAVLAGNVTASVLSMAEGAKIQGVARVSQDKEVNSLFDENLEL